jgi:hypothetical protein
LDGWMVGWMDGWMDGWRVLQSEFLTINLSNYIVKLNSLSR